MNIEPNVERIVPIPQTERLTENRSEEKRASNVQQDPARVQISDVARDFSKAVQQLQADEEVRPDVVKEGEEILRNWTSPSDEQVDVIINKIFDEA